MTSSNPFPAIGPGECARYIAAGRAATNDISAQVSRILDYATFGGIQDDGEGGGIQLWTLRKAIPGHPVGSTVSRQTLDAAIFGPRAFASDLFAMGADAATAQQQAKVAEFQELRERLT